MAAVWRQQAERGNLLALRAIVWVAQRLGRPVARLLLVPISLYFLVAMPRARRASTAYLRRVLGREPRWTDGFRHVHCFAATILDRFYLLNGRFDWFDVQMSGQHMLREVLSQGHGAVMIGAHLGSFEAARATSQIPGDLKVSMVMYEDNAVRLNQVLAAINPAVQHDIIPLGNIDSMLRVRHCLERGEMVGMLCDRTLNGEPGRRVDLLGAPAEFPTGPFRLAAMLKRPVVMMVGLYRGGKRYEIHFEHIADFSRPGAPTVDQTIDLYVSRVAHYCREAPYNWFNFYDFWDELGEPRPPQP